MKPINRSLICVIFALVSLPAPVFLHAQTAASSSECSQPTEERDDIIREAEKDQYTTRRVEFLGNRYTRDTTLRRRTNIGLQEGELFTRQNLVRSLRNVSKLKQIYPVQLKDVELRLNRDDKTVDMMICFKERARRAAKGGS